MREGVVSRVAKLGISLLLGALGTVLFAAGALQGSGQEGPEPHATPLAQASSAFRAVAPGIAKDSGEYQPPAPSPTETAVPTQTPAALTTTATASPTAIASLTPTATTAPTSTPTPPAGGGPTYRYVALGDSLATGVLAFRGYVPRYADHIRDDTGASVSLSNRAQNGWTSDQLLAALRTDQSMRQAVRNADVVTWDIGGNDLRAARTAYKQGTCGGDDNQDCLRAAEAHVKANWNAIIAEILALRGVDEAVMRTMDLYNPYVTEDKADGSFAAFKPYVDRINAHMRSTAGAAGIGVAGVYAAFNGPEGEQAAGQYITFDGLHPNDSGHALIARLLRDLGYEPLVP